MYHCPHCDEGPFSAADWWDHVGLHNAPWLQSRDPKDLERTDLGYGEDIQGMTTVPTHDMPNEPGFTPEKFGWVEARLPDVPSHRMVWLSQPNNTSLKYWHHKPSNLTYAWDATGGSQTTKMHHLDAADDIAANHGGNHPLGSPDWEGGFYEQNEMGRHPADLWGLPSQVDYAPIQGGY